MNINLYDNEWIIDNVDEYIIGGNKEEGYQVLSRKYDDEKDDDIEEILYESKDFEECLVWIYNS